MAILGAWGLSLNKHFGRIAPAKIAKHVYVCIACRFLVPRMDAAGVTEELKAHDPMRWVGLMNTLKAQAEEIIENELIYI